MAGNDGGAVYLYDSSEMFILDCNISRSVSGNSGGALYGRRNTNMTISDSMIDSNRAENSGGGVYAQQDSFVTIENCVFKNNVAEYGGAIRVYIESFADVRGCSFDGNRVSLSGGAIAVYKESVTIVIDSTFVQNMAGFGSALVAYNSNITLDNSTVCSNRAQLGGAIRVLQANVMLIICTFRNNTAISDGGVLYTDSSLTMIDTCTFTKNIAEHNGGVAYYTSSSQLIVNNTTFDQNSAKYDGGVIYTSSSSNTSIDGGVFSGNRAENSGGVIALVGQSHIIITSSNFTQNHAVDAGGVISCLQQSNISICNSTFTNSSTTASSGGVLHIHNGTLILRDSNFTHNRAQESGGVIDAHHSSVLIIICSTFDSNVAKTSHGGALYLTQDSNSSIINSIFEENMAEKSGGGISLSISSKLDVTKSLFKNSTAQIGAALAAIQNSSISFKNQELLGELCNVNDLEATVVLYNEAEFNGSIYLSDGSALYIGEETNISHNIASMFGGGIYAINSLITIGSTQFNLTSNRAKYGGGLCLANSNIETVTDNDLDDVNSAINFLWNKAEYYGGAIHVDDDSKSPAACSTNSITDSAPTCFFQDTTGGLMINLDGNDAERGQDLYGGLLDRCTFAQVTNSSKRDVGGDSHFLNLSNIDNFDTVSSKAVRVCLCKDSQPNCSQTADDIDIRRGKINTFILKLAAVDQIHHSVPATIASSFNDDSVSSNQPVRASSTNCMNVEFQVSFPKASNYTLNIFPDGPCTDRGTSDFSVEINVMDCICPPGFMLQENSTNCRCICDNKLSELIETLECNIAEESIIREGEFWVTFLNSSDSTYSYFFYPHCPYDYCKPPTVPTSIKLSEPRGSDAQCINNRGGLLCGSCQSSYSISLGSSKCVECPTNWGRYGLPIGIIVAALIAGIVLVVLILVFNLTVTVGTLNSIIFYANIIDVNRSVYFRQLHLTFVPVFISWLNLDIGFDTCFIEGMDTYYKIWLQLAFPAYIIFIVIAIIWISSCSSKFSNLIGKKDPVATLAILILLSYTKLLQTVIVSFSFVSLNYPHETNSTLRWLPDANIEFAAGGHIALICVAVLILMLGIVYTFLIFSWRWLRECKGCKCAKNQRLHSFIDTYHIPHTIKHRYWTGLLLLVRIIVYILSAFSASIDPRITFLSVIAIMSCLLLYKTTFVIRVYKNWLLNAMDSFVYFNIMIFTAFTWLTQDDLHSETKRILQMVIAYVSVGMVIILTMFIIIFHVYRYSNNKLYSIGQNTKLAKKISAKIDNISEDTTQKDVWSKSRGTYKLFSAIDDPRKSSGYVPPPLPLIATASTVSIEECDEALTSDAQYHVGKSKKKRRAKTDTPKGDFSKTSLREFALLRKTESKFPFRKENTSSDRLNLLAEDNEL
jgi:predicted outer membrane repeat protein